MLQTNIEPVQVFPGIATMLQIESALIHEFGNSDGCVTLKWSLLSNDQKILRQDKTNLIGEDYTGWTDDSYLLDKLCQILNLSRII